MSGDRGWWTRGVAAASLLAASLVTPVTASARVPAASELQGAPNGPLDTDTLARGRYAAMAMRLKKTIFRVDVADVEVRYDDATRDRIRQLVEGRRYSDALADRVAQTVLAAPDVLVRVRFHRDVGYDKFLEMMRSNARCAWESRRIDVGEYRAVSDSLRDTFGFLGRRGPREGDELLYRVQHGVTRMLYRDGKGRILLDMMNADPARALLGGCLGPCSEPLEPLVRSLLAQRS